MSGMLLEKKVKKMKVVKEETYMENDVDKFMALVMHKKKLEDDIREAMTTPDVLANLVGARVVSCTINYGRIVHLLKERERPR